MSSVRSLLFVAVLFGCALAGRAQITFNFVPDGSIDPQAQAGFEAAATRWSAVLFDPIAVNITIGYEDLGNGVLASAGSGLEIVSYADFKSRMTADRTSANDNTAVASLPAGSLIAGELGFGVLLNHTQENPNNPGHPETPYTGHSTALAITRANARALGLYPAWGGSADAAITFGSGVTWDFNPNDGISAGAYDFVGAATHEIGHALGFMSGVDYLDQHPNALEGSTYQTAIDMFRYSIDSQALGLMDGTADNRTNPKYFSLDGGVTSLGLFSNGVTFGDGRQASHWKDDLGLGVMDPTAATGELLGISALDLVAFDVMGYNLTAIPEPGATALWAGALAAVAVGRCRRRRAAG